ncbi:hypothetical protein BT69DRAFT_242157 [Atractiella rhizophila]|nr:hypothetical protein BT69DRAFT_242157 [Atractiella rhizophila]
MNGGTRLVDDMYHLRGFAVNEAEDVLAVTKNGGILLCRHGEQPRLIYESASLKGSFCITLCDLWGIIAPSGTANAEVLIVDIKAEGVNTIPVQTTYCFSYLHVQTLATRSRSLAIYDRRANAVHITQLPDLSQTRTITCPLPVTCLRLDDTGAHYAGTRTGLVFCLTHLEESWERHTDGVRDLSFRGKEVWSVGRDGTIVFDEKTKVKLRGGWVEQVRSPGCT